MSTLECVWRRAYVLHEMGRAGSNYNGWQFQHDQPSIQGLLETVLSRKLQQPIRVVGLAPMHPPCCLFPMHPPCAGRELGLLPMHPPCGLLPMHPPCLSVSLRKSASKNSKMSCIACKKKMGRSFSHRHWRPLTRPGLAPVARYRIGALGWCFASPLDVFRHCQS